MFEEPFYYTTTLEVSVSTFQIAELPQPALYMLPRCRPSHRWDLRALVAGPHLQTTEPFPSASVTYTLPTISALIPSEEAGSWAAVAGKTDGPLASARGRVPSTIPAELYAVGSEMMEAIASSPQQRQPNAVTRVEIVRAVAGAIGVSLGDADVIVGRDLGRHHGRR